MKRPLTKQERKITATSLKAQEENLKDLLEAKEMKKIVIEKLHPYNRRLEDKRDKKELDALDEQINTTTFTIETARKQLKEGVDEISGVN